MIAERCPQPELMDQPGLKAELHRQALIGLKRINTLSRSSAILWPPIKDLARRIAPRAVRLLDLASGGGDVPLALARRSACHGMKLEIDGSDLSPFAVEHANRQAAAVDGVRFFPLDALGKPLPLDYHVVTCSLFLHHLSERDAAALLRKMAAAAQHLVLINDLRRSQAGYALAWLGCRTLTRSPIVRVDGPRSVAAAFTCRELRKLARESGLTGATVSRRWPQRLLLTWWRN